MTPAIPPRVVREVHRSVSELGALFEEAANIERFAGPVAAAESSPAIVRHAAVHVATLERLRRRARELGAADALEAEIGAAFRAIAPRYARRLEAIGRGALAA